MIFTIVLFCICIEAIVAAYNVKYAVAVALGIMLMIPGVVKFDLGSLNLNVFNFSMIVVTTLTVIKLHKNIHKGRCNLRQNMHKLKQAFIAYTLYVVITSFIASFGDIPMGEYLKDMVLFILEFIIMGYCLMYIQVDSEAIRLFDIVLVVGGCLIIVYGCLNYVSGINPYMAYIALQASMDVDMSNAFQEEVRGAISGRVSSTFVHPLQLGQCALLLFAYSLYQFKGKFNKYVFYLFLFGLIVMVVLSGSRSSIVPLAMVVIIYLLSKGKKKIVMYGVGIFFGFIALYPVLPEKYQLTIESMLVFWNDKASTKADVGGSTVSGRLGQLEAAFTAIGGKEFFGYGTGHVNNYGDDHPGLYGYESIVLSFLVDNGIFGLFAFVTFYMYLYRFLIRKCKRRFDKARVHCLCLSFFVSISLTGISYSFFTLYMIFYFMTYYNIIIQYKNDTQIYSLLLAKRRRIAQRNTKMH